MLTRTFVFNSSTAASESTYDLIVGFQPKAMIFVHGTGNSVADILSTSNALKATFGFYANGKQISISRGTDSDIVTGDDKAARVLVSTASVVTCLDAFTPNPEMLHTISDVSVWPSDGFRLGVVTNSGNSARFSTWCMGGSSIQNADIVSFQLRTTPGAQSINVGFRPTCIFLIGAENTSNIIGDGGQNMFFSWATAATTGSQFLWSSACDGAADNPTRRHSGSVYLSPIDCIAHANAWSGSNFVRANFTQFTDTGFDINVLKTNGLAYYVHCLAIKGGSYKSGYLYTNTSAGQFTSQTGIGFQPKGAIFLSNMSQTSSIDSIPTAQNNYMLSFGMSGSGISPPSGSHAKALLVTQSYAIEHDNVYIRINSSSNALAGLMKIDSFDTDGFTPNMVQADISPSYVGYLAFGDDSPQSSYVRTGTSTFIKTSPTSRFRFG